MKKPFLICFLLILALCSANSAPADTLRILTIGNSYTVDAVNENFGELCAAAGKHVILGNINKGGCSLERHCRNMEQDIPDYIYYKRTDDGKLHSTKKSTLQTAVLDEPWDIVTFQQQSAMAGKASSIEPYLNKLVDYVRVNTPPSVRLMWYQTWAYNTNSLNPDMKKLYGTRDNMHKQICLVAEEVCRKYNMGVIPVGTAVQNLRKSFDRDNCNRDAIHLNYTIGRYTAACTWFEAIFGEDVTANSYICPNLTPYRAELARAAAHFAVQTPSTVADMVSKGFGTPVANYDESKIPAYTLPDPLVFADGRPVKNRKMWPARRAELLDLFTEEMFGKAPEAPENLEFEVLRTRNDALGGKASCKEVRVHFTKGKYAYMDLIVFTPNNVKKAPMFLGVNFQGNFAITDDPWVSIGLISQKHGIAENRKRGSNTAAWPLEMIIDAGFGVATFYRGDVAPDFDNSFNLGVFSYMRGGKRGYPAENEWGNIAAWAWGLSRAMDYLETDADVDASKVAVIGHSRLGKAALWAGATDQRFAMVVSNNSGCGGAAISRRCIGERVEIINKSFPYWFCENFKKYNNRENELPFDQNELLSLIAPRPLYVASSDEDRWADPASERMALEDAQRVYKLLGAKGKTAYHIKNGRHSITEVDWRKYLDFAKKQFK